MRSKHSCFYTIIFFPFACFGKLSDAMVNSATSDPYPEMLRSDAKEVRDSSTGNIVSVATKMNYVTADTVEINIRRGLDGSDSGMEGIQWNPAEVHVRNARGMSKTVDVHGFELVEDPVDAIDYLDTDQVIDNYYPSCENLIRKVFGPNVDVAKAFDHNIRLSGGSHGQELKGSGGSKAQVPIGEVHGDYTETSGPKRLSDLSNTPKANDVLKNRLGDKSLLDPKIVQDAISGKRRFVLINVWRSIDTTHAIEQKPLACVDAASVSENEMKVLKIHYKDRIGENYLIAHDKEHQWCYYPAMEHKEAMLIKQWDSFGDSKSKDAERMAKFAIHSAFEDPTSPENARPRRSIEVRVAVIWKED